MPSLDDQVAPDATEDRPVTPLKRKREDQAEPVDDLNGTAPGKRTFQSIRDIWTLLNSHPSAPSTKSALQSDSSSSSDPPSKRAKSKQSKTELSKTISDKVKDESYQNFDDFSTDVIDLLGKALQALETDAKLASIKQWKYTPESIEDDQQVADVKSLTKYFHEIVRRESDAIQKTQPNNIKQEETDPKPLSNGQLPNGIKHEPEDSVPLDGRHVLTLYGNAQGHKQLYSSFQAPPPSQDSEESPSHEAPRLREEGLPIGISTLTIPSVKAKEAAVQNKRTFIEAFGPPSRLPQLAPPETPKVSSARGALLTWAPHTPAIKNTSNRSQDKLIYQKQQLPTGAWLGYGGVIVNTEPTSAEAKRKQRDRALSTGEAGRLSSDAAIAAQLQAKEEALFRSVYSSFAPSFDNSLAVVPEEVKNQIWWEKSGRQFYDEVFAIDPALEDAIIDDEPAELVDDEMDLNNDEDEDEKFKEVVENYEAPSLEPLSLKNENTDIDVKLQRISELLETIHSHQRIRNSTISSGNHTPISPSPSLQDLRGTPSMPSTAEIEVFNDVKARLASIVASLPPYVVSKLHGDQLEDLIISRNIVMETPDVKGVLEEDQNTRLARAAAITAAISTGQAQVRTGANQYGPYVSRKVQPHNQYTPGGASRNAPSFQRQNLSNWQSPAQNYAATVQRPSYAQNLGYAYNQQTPRAPNTAPQMRGQPLAQYMQRPNNIQPNGQYTPNQQYPTQPSPVGMPNMGSPTKPPQMSGQNNPMYRPPSAGMPRPPSAGGSTQGVNQHALNAATAISPRPQTPSSAAPGGFPAGSPPQAQMQAPVANMQVPISPAQAQPQFQSPVQGSVNENSAPPQVRKPDTPSEAQPPATPTLASANDNLKSSDPIPAQPEAQPEVNGTGPSASSVTAVPAGDATENAAE